jgi:pimeloyl-ACP methyl ester carboxylesterase
MADEEVRIPSDGCTLAGTFTDPPSPVAAALVVTGSGKVDRDTNARLLRIGVTKSVAEALTGARVATLRYDKRGIGRSGGDYLRADMTDNLADARAALGWLAGRRAGVPLLVAGLSEGAVHAAQLAASEPTVAGVVLLGAPCHTGEEIINWQIEMMAGRLPRVVRVIMSLTRTDFTRSQHKTVARLKASTGDVLRMRGIRVNARWYREFLGCDPAPAFARITAPVLAITGGHDLHVPPSDVEAIGALVRGPFEGHVVGDLSHLLRHDPARVGPRGYRRAVRQPVSSEVLTIITDWLEKRWGQG